MDRHYEYFSIIDFAADDVFLQHYLHPTEQSLQAWENWLAQHPEKREEWSEARKLLEAVQSGLSDYARTFLSEEAEAELLARILETNRQKDQHFKPRSDWWNHRWSKIGVAAALAAGLFLGADHLLRKDSTGTTLYDRRVAVLEQHITEEINGGADVRTFYLPDSTEFTLFPGSRLSYSKGYGRDSRTVYLSGKAVFEVRKNPQRPFYVYAGEIVTKVLGTRFEVTAFEKEGDVLVKVNSGQVSVYKSIETEGYRLPLNAERKGVLLLPNQQVVFRKHSEQFDKLLIEKPLLLPAYEKKRFLYEEHPVIDVFEDLEKAYGIEILKNDDVLKNCGLTANLTDESLDQKLSVICRSIGATYEILDARIIINSKGCKPE